MLGRYIDALPPAAIARILNAKAWRVYGYVDAHGARDLLGHAEDWYWNICTDAPGCGAPELLDLREVAGDSWLNWPPLIGRRFDHLAARLGLMRVVQLVARRAGRHAGNAVRDRSKVMS